MIWHFFEVWILFLAVFAVGCGLGTLVHVGLAAGPLALVQDHLANAVGDGLDRLKWRLGLAPDWRPELRRTYEWPDLDRGPDPANGEAIAAAVTERDQWTDTESPSPESWDAEADWPDDGAADEEPYEYESEDFGSSDAAQFDEAVGGEPEFRETDMMRPAGLAEPRAGVPDNLQRIWGIGKRNEELLNSLGIYHFSQIAAWTPAEARWVSARLAFPERLERDNWIGQAIVLATGGDPSTVSPSNRLEISEPDQG
jgi:predicted flap endonuclease-1-like 5' DNA nuclease